MARWINRNTFSFSLCSIHNSLFLFSLFLQFSPIPFPSPITDGIPNDGIPRKDTVTIAIPLSVVYTILAIAGLLFSVACLIFNFIFREKKYTPYAVRWMVLRVYCLYHRLIRLSSPKLNYITGVGAIIFFMNVIFLAIPTIDPDLITVLCNVCFTQFSSMYRFLAVGRIIVKLQSFILLFSAFLQPCTFSSTPVWLLSVTLSAMGLFWWRWLESGTSSITPHYIKRL